MLKVTAVIENTIKGEYIGPEEFESTSALLESLVNRPAIDFYLRSRADGKLVCERYLKTPRKHRSVRVCRDCGNPLVHVDDGTVCHTPSCEMFNRPV